MRKKKTYHQEIKRILRPEITHCVECQKKLQRCVTISDRRIITLKQVLHVVHNAENTTESTKERLKQILAPVVALKLPVIGVRSSAHPTELQAVETSGLVSPIKCANFTPFVRQDD